MAAPEEKSTNKSSAMREVSSCICHVPTAFALALPDLGRYDLTSLRYVIWGGASMPRKLIDAIARLAGARMATTYGSTETGGSVTYTDPDASPATT